MMPQATVVLPAPEVVPPMTTLGIMRSALPLDALLGPDARIHRVLELHHLGREVRGGDKLGRCVAAREHDVLEARAIAQRRDHVVELDPAPFDRVRDLVEQEELVALLGRHSLDTSPALARLSFASPPPSPRAPCRLTPRDPSRATTSRRPSSPSRCRRAPRRPSPRRPSTCRT